MKLKSMSEAISEKCWICGNLAGSGEHKIKHSDLRDTFGTRSIMDPPLHFRSEARSETVPDFDDAKLKFDKDICGPCNNVTTAPFDHAWMTLSRYLRASRPNSGDKIDLATVFTKATGKNIENLQLYFVKTLGCAINDSGGAFNLASLSAALRGGTAHPDIYLTFDEPVQSSQRFVSMSNLTMGGTFANLIITMDVISVTILHCLPTDFLDGVATPWHPRCGSLISVE